MNQAIEIPLVLATATLLALASYAAIAGISGDPVGAVFVSWALLIVVAAICLGYMVERI